MNEEIVGAIQSRCELVFKLAQLDFKSKLILSLVKVKRIITGSSNSPMENVQCATTVHLAPTNRVSHFYTFFELSLVLLTTHAIGLYEVTKKI